MSPVSCANCGLDVTALDVSASERQPCPRCGGVARAYGIVGSGGVSIASPIAAGSAVVTFITYPQRLIRLAQQLMGDGEFSIAVVVAHIACEVAVSRKFSDAFVARGIPDLEDAFMRLFSGYSLSNGRLRRLYETLSGDCISEQPFWAEYQASATLRHEIVHRGAIGKGPDAASAIDAATALVKHLDKWGGAA